MLLLIFILGLLKQTDTNMMKDFVFASVRTCQQEGYLKHLVCIGCMFTHV